jgi:predicted transcriptional regulator
VNYRDRVDIIAKILAVASPGARKTQIMYQANLSFKILNRYLKDTLASSLLTLEEGQQFYVVTTKGEDFLRAYRKYSEISRKAESHVDKMREAKKVLEALCPDK